MKDAKGHGSNPRGAMPLEGHPYHLKSNSELHYIAKDAGEAAKAMQGHSPQAENKYLDQVNDASTVIGYRQRGGEDLSHATRRAEAIDRSTGVGRHGYNADAVNQAIASNNRHGPKIGRKEAKQIHRLLRGRD